MHRSVASVTTGRGPVLTIRAVGAGRLVVCTHPFEVTLPPYGVAVLRLEVDLT